jgi:DNA-directed RNA polymerase subunit RPC12/RpoP
MISPSSPELHPEEIDTFYEGSSMTPTEQKEGIAVLFCKYCGTRLQLSRIEPSLTPGYDRMVYECRKCGHSLTKERGVGET